MEISMLVWLLTLRIGLKNIIAEKVDTQRVFDHGIYSELKIFQIGKKLERKIFEIRNWQRISEIIGPVVQRIE
jgi:hypothetical protein